ncbi:hydrolase 2, exosortase A system-associated [Rubrivivax rivuli]|uniref:Hydrolase 2, exosortase A system-associated n=1 Tax=Rubrivivax rivuli TaxID=1862385 RepID=A0A437RLW1_9BURK|nr:hydrolase 2, exosortase A system-associated [Rubrivivax rivuli]RVU47777.1 hydrolase 2, exosortase A system-associated [Rubrivivax rivuli]
MATTEAFYTAVQPSPLGQRFCLWHADAAQAPRALVVHVHAFAEEMNKSRRMVALQSRALAAAGFAVWRMDLLGCGDSAGEFSDASWAAWVDDVLASVALARERHAATWPGAAPPELWLWGQRAGALLAAEAAQALAEPVNLLFWQPSLQGKQVLQQFLRLETAGALLGKNQEASSTQADAKGGARAALARGEVAAVAGYGLAPALTTGLEAARLAAPARQARLEWLDLAPAANQEPTPAAQRHIEAWTAAGWQVRHRSVAGPSFWQTTEIEEAPDLLEATTHALLTSPMAVPSCLGQAAQAALRQVAA